MGAELPARRTMTDNGLGSVPLSAAARGLSARAGQAPVIAVTMARPGSALLHVIPGIRPESARSPQTSPGAPVT
jgi:hypothetical protein